MKEEIRFKANAVKEWQEWLDANHNQFDHCWLIIAKKSSKIPSLSIGEAIAEAICYGWVDSRKRGIDENYYMVYFTPRKNTSQWSEANLRIAQKLITSGKMKPPGLEVLQS